MKLPPRIDGPIRDAERDTATLDDSASEDYDDMSDGDEDRTEDREASVISIGSVSHPTLHASGITNLKVTIV